MKCVFKRIIAAVLVVGALCACSPQQETSKDKGTVSVLVPQSNEKEGYSLKVVELLGIEDLRTVSGKFVRFFMSPRITGNKLNGSPAVARFIKNSAGEQIPANDLTQQMVTIYAHTQQFALLDEELGAGGVNQWPRDVGIGVNVTGGLNNNAFYDGRSDAMLVVPYNRAGLPIAINAGILAHEHFHSLFYKIVIKDKSDLDTQGETLLFLKDEDDQMDEQSMREYYSFAMLRGLNEGLADYWGWLYTGDPDFIALSLAEAEKERSLKNPEFYSVYHLPGKKTVQRNIKFFYDSGKRSKLRAYIIGYAYEIGTKFSRMLKSFTEESAQSRDLESQKVRKEVGKAIVKMLPLLRETMVNSKFADFTAVEFVKSFSKVWPKLNQKECKFLFRVLDRSSEDVNARYFCQQNEAGDYLLEEEITGGQ